MSDNSPNVTTINIARVAMTAVATALLSITLVTYQDVSGLKQFMLDHAVSHDLESENCAEYRASVRRELDLIWHKINERSEVH